MLHPYLSFGAQAAGWAALGLPGVCAWGPHHHRHAMASYTRSLLPARWPCGFQGRPVCEHSGPPVCVEQPRGREEHCLGPSPQPRKVPLSLTGHRQGTCPLRGSPVCTTPPWQEPALTGPGWGRKGHVSAFSLFKSPGHKFCTLPANPIFFPG